MQGAARTCRPTGEKGHPPSPPKKNTLASGGKIVCNEAIGRACQMPLCCEACGRLPRPYLVARPLACAFVREGRSCEAEQLTGSKADVAGLDLWHPIRAIFSGRESTLNAGRGRPSFWLGKLSGEGAYRAVWPTGRANRQRRREAERSSSS